MIENGIVEEADLEALGKYRNSYRGTMESTNEIIYPTVKNPLVFNIRKLERRGSNGTHPS